MICQYTDWFYGLYLFCMVRFLLVLVPNNLISSIAMFENSHLENPPDMTAAKFFQHAHLFTLHSFKRRFNLKQVLQDLFAMPQLLKAQLISLEAEKGTMSSFIVLQLHCTHRAVRAPLSFSFKGQRLSYYPLDSHQRPLSDFLGFYMFPMVL